jgi:predicted acyltransferase
MSDATSIATESPNRAKRVYALDMLRGFVMIFIMAGAGYRRSFEAISEEGFWGFLATQLEHPPWEGLVFYDLIFPTFIFCIGVSLVYSLERMLRDEGKRAVYWRILKRTALLYFLGVLEDGGLREITDENVICGVLQRLALCYGITSVLYLNFKRRGLLVIFGTIMVGYWILFTMVPVPGVGVVSMVKHECWPNWIAQQIPPYYEDDPEDLSSTLTAVCTCLLGVFTAMLLRDSKRAPKQILLRLLGLSALCLAVGYAWWWLHFPVIKRAWTSSYVLVAGGYSLLFLSVFYGFADVLQWRGPWTKPLIWTGMNALTIYMLSFMLRFNNYARWFVGGPIEEAAGVYGELLVNLTSLTLALLFLRWMYNRKIFLRL